MSCRLIALLALACALFATSVESKTLVETIEKALNETEIVTQREREKEMSEEYQSVVWNVAKFKSLMAGISEGFYDSPDVLDNDHCLDGLAIDAMYRMLIGIHKDASFWESWLKITSSGYVFWNTMQENC